MNSRREVLGLPIILWIIVAATIGTLITAGAVSYILNIPPQVMISWNQPIPSNSIVSHFYYWSINVQSSQTDESAHIDIWLRAKVPLTDYRILSATYWSVQSQQNETLLGIRMSDGQIILDAPVPIQQGSNTPGIVGSWVFTSRAPLTTYTLSVFLDLQYGRYVSNIINSTTILST